MRRLTIFVTAGALITLGGCTQIGLIDSSAPTREVAKQASQGNAEAQYQMGLRFTNGADALQDYPLGVQYFSDAAKQGHTNAQYMLGMAYYLGRGTNVNYEKARHWLEMAAEHNHREAMHYLGEIYFNGYGTERAPAWGIQWIGQAAEMGYAESQYLLGVSYLSGLGSPKSKQQGQAWLRTANKGGSLRAGELLKTLKLSTTGAGAATAHPSHKALEKKYRIRYVQIRLNQLGFPAGAADGVWGPATERAAQRFMKSNPIALNTLIDKLRDIKENP